MPDFEITLGNAVDLDIDVWQEDHKEPEQSSLDFGPDYCECCNGEHDV